ncbi:MAG: HAD family hydrolase [Eubacteriales bacterium]|jgi:phosphoglycolate phosphatase
MRYKAAIFDMDGTVLNTVTDLKNAINWALEQTGHRHDYNDDDTKAFFGSGVNVAISRALIIEKMGGHAGDPGVLDELLKVGFSTGVADYGISEKELERIAEVYRPYYASHCDICTGPYAGIPELLKNLRGSGVKTAVVSNKPDEAVRTLSADKFPGMFDFVLGEKQGIRRKPEPDMTDACLEALGVKRSEAVYIGDTEIDQKTAENGGMDCIGVTWGFRGRAFLEAHGEKIIVDTPAEVGSVILGD